MSLGSNGVDQVCSLRKLQCGFVARTYVLIAPVQYVLQQVSCSYEMIQRHPNTRKLTEILVQGPMGWMGHVGCEKLQRTSWRELLQ